MSGFRVKQLLAPFLLAGLALPALAQNAADVPVSPLPAPPVVDRRASFLPADANTPAADDAFSGLATAPPEAVSPVVIEAPAPAPAPPSTPTLASSPTPVAATSPPTANKTADIIAAPVVTTVLPEVSNESIGTQSDDNLGATMWKGTPRPVAEHELSLAGLTSSPVLNHLMRRLLTTSAVPPEGTSDSTQSLTSMRVEKLVDFADINDAWGLTKRADAKLIDDITYHFVAENALANDSDEPCAQIADLSKTRANVDWQKVQIVCQLRAKDTKAAQVALDVMRAQPNRDNVFLGIADKSLLGSSKVLPHQLTPLTPTVLALLKLSGMSLPNEIYVHPDFALAASLLKAPAQQDVAQLALAERAVERGVISTADLAALYRAIPFSADILAAPLGSSESGLRLRALLFHAAEGESAPGKRIAYAVKFVQSATPAFLNGANSMVADMLGAIKPDPALAENAVMVARIYALAGQKDAALEWLKIAPRDPANIQDSHNLWPQFVLAGLESDAAYRSEIGTWLDQALKPDAQTDMRATFDSVSASLLLLDAAGFTVPDAAWGKVLAAAHLDKHIALSTLLLERLQAAGAAGRRAETVLLSAAVAGDSEISLPAAVAITRALRLAGFKSEAALFARQTIALLMKQN